MRALGLRFDSTLTYTGGTDALFFRQMNVAGFRIVYAASARVREILGAAAAANLDFDIRMASEDLDTFIELLFGALIEVSRFRCEEYRLQLDDLATIGIDAYPGMGSSATIAIFRYAVLVAVPGATGRVHCNAIRCACACVSRIDDAVAVSIRATR